MYKRQIFGTVTDERLNNEMRITLIGTGFPTLNGSYKSEKTESNRPSINRSNTSQESSNSNNQNDLDIPPFLRK